MRKIIDITIGPDGKRDAGKVFRITEMPAAQAEKWAVKALLALTRADVDIGNAQGLGMAGIAVLGLQAFGGVNFAEAEPLMDEMFACVQAVPSPGIVRPLVEDDTEEIATRARLRAEVFTLHTGFSFADVRSKLTSTLASAVTPPSIPMSQDQLVS